MSRTEKRDDVLGKAAQEFLDNVEEHHESGVGMLLVGPAGAGKTYLAAAILNALPERYTQRFYPLHTFLRIPIATMNAERLMNIDPDAKKPIKDWKWYIAEMKRLRNRVDFLVVDDVGMEHRPKGSDYAVDEFEILLRTRFDNALPTILTSNIPVARWGDVYGPAMASFLHEACPPVAVVGSDLRL